MNVDQRVPAIARVERVVQLAAGERHAGDQQVGVGELVAEPRLLLLVGDVGALAPVARLTGQAGADFVALGCALIEFFIDVAGVERQELADLVAQRNPVFGADTVLDFRQPQVGAQFVAATVQAP